MTSTHATQETATVDIGGTAVQISDKGDAIHVTAGKHNQDAIVVLREAVAKQFSTETGFVYGNATSHWNFDVSTGIDPKKSTDKDAQPQEPKVTINDIVQIAKTFENLPADQIRQQANKIKLSAAQQHVEERARKAIQPYFDATMATLARKNIVLDEAGQEQLKAGLAKAHVRVGQGRG